MKRVYRAASLIQVAHARNVLISAGIRCELRNQYLAGAMGDLPMMETWPQLFVDDADERYALSVLAGASRAQAGLRGSAMSAGSSSSRNSRAAGVAVSNGIRAPLKAFAAPQMRMRHPGVSCKNSRRPLGRRSYKPHSCTPEEKFMETSFESAGGQADENRTVSEIKN